ncbi:cupin domain-containing protein [Streptomyces sp. CSDS2]|uniref:cupin domain-containing protein n=1 Tax=Streptomyces sp. CSDS2 TaxID=3055051 RepID=UPI0025B0F168|nr:cupin domain-containing protein [Streptomyces sp. CSDS2]MDN3259033.1 cupin domain-containing protein [Streptomyces sp. CSDS2]
MSLYIRTSAQHTPGQRPDDRREVRTRPDESYLGTPEQAEQVPIGTNVCRMLVPTQATGGRLGLFSLSMPPNGPYASPHFHKEMTELFVVLSGEVTLTRGETPVTARPGTALYVPPGTPHGFANVSDTPAELLIAFMPGRHREDFFRGLAELLNRDVVPGEQELEEFAERFDQYRYRS